MFIKINKNFTLFLNLVLVTTLLSSCNSYSLVKPQKKTFSHYVLNENYKPSQTLLELLKYFKIEHDNTLENIVTETQKRWLRPFGMEPFQIQDTYASSKNELNPLLKKLGLIDAVNPTKKQYTYGLIHGATCSSIRKRLAYLINLWKKGIQFDHVVFLTGARVLDSEKESKVILCDQKQTVLPIRTDWIVPKELPITEFEMVGFIYNQATLPKEFKKLPTTIINAPEKILPNGSKQRPNTHDTIKAWLQTEPKPGSCLAISDQPYIGYQDSTVRSVLPEQFELETVGNEKLQKDVSISICLDSLARWLYQENIKKQTTKKN